MAKAGGPAAKRARVQSHPAEGAAKVKGADISVEGVEDIAKTVGDDPAQPDLRTYPKTAQGGRERSFVKEWFKSRPWLEYSQLADACFCFACRAFKSSRMDDRWIMLGFSNWKKAMDKSAGITLHENSELHVASMSKWANWKQAQQDGNIAEKLELISRADILANRHYLQSVAQAVLVCAVQNIALAWPP